MNRFVTFCKKVGIALLVLAVISNTAYAATTTETADGDPTMTTGTFSGTYTNTWSDEGTTQDLLEVKVGNKYYLDCYYNLTTAIDESRISAFEIGVNAWYTIEAGKTDSFTVYVWDYGTSSWDSTTITVTATLDGTTYTNTTTMGIEHIRDSDGNIAIRFDDNDAGNKQSTLYIDYLYVKLTYTTISDVATDKLTYRVGETITTTWTPADGFGSGENYINVEYWDVTAGTQFDLKSYATSATSSTSKSLTSSEAGRTIAVYVYTTSSSSGDRSTAITQGDPWPYSIPNAIEGPIITSCNSAGDEINEFAPGENVSVKAEGLEASTTYKIWIQNDPVNEGDSLIVGENPSSAETPKEVNTDGSGNFGPTLIWSIPSDAPITHHEYDIVVNKGTGEVGQTYNAADDGLDSATVAGIVAPVPDVSSLILFASGLVLVSVYFVYGRRRREEEKK